MNSSTPKSSIPRHRSLTTSVALFLAIQGASGLGCGSESNPGTDLADASGGTGGAGMTAGSGGSSMPAGGGGTGGSTGSGGSQPSDAGASTSTGEIVFFAPHFSAGGAYYASFDDPNHPAAPSSYSCTGTTYGPCVVSECTPIDAGSDSSTVKKPQAGTISVTSGDAGLSETLVPDTNGSYAAKSPMRTKLLGEELLDFAATGGEVPAFHETVQYPLVFLLNEPALPDGGVLMVSRAQDLKLVWARGIADGTFLVQASSGNLSVTTADLHCSVAADAGTLTIPAAALSKIGAPTPLQLFTVRNHTFQAGAYAVTIRVASEVATPDKREAASITLQ